MSFDSFTSLKFIISFNCTSFSLTFWFTPSNFVGTKCVQSYQPRLRGVKASRDAISPKRPYLHARESWPLKQPPSWQCQKCALDDRSQQRPQNSHPRCNWLPELATNGSFGRQNTVAYTNSKSKWNRLSDRSKQNHSVNHLNCLTYLLHASTITAS